MKLLWKILLSTSVAITVLFAAVGWIVQTDAARTTAASLADEARASFQAYESLWHARVDRLATVSRILATMADVRAAFSTGDRATIRDTAGELWSRVSEEDAMFLVTDPGGRVIASLGGIPDVAMQQDLPVVRQAASRFPEQVSGLTVRNGRLYQVSVTPVYVHGESFPALINVLVAGIHVDANAARRLKRATGGSEFLFLAEGGVTVSTIPPVATRAVAAAIGRRERVDRVSDGSTEYAVLVTPLSDVQGRSIGRLCILRDFESARRRIAGLRRNIVLLWLFAVAAGLGLTYVLARRLIEPVNQLDRAAAEVARQNYDCRVPAGSDDELGRLARTFNAMCASIRSAREELIRQERISTIGRLAGSIVHDLRNPLAAIYGGAEMLVDRDLPHSQVQRLAGNIYRASRRMQELLQDLLDVARGKSAAPEWCNLREVAAAACDGLRTAADAQAVIIAVQVPDHLELPLERSRMERVFLNLISNALEVMPDGGTIEIDAERQEGSVLVRVRDTGPGIPAELQGRLFQPFATSGKRNGMGLGLALSRQAVLDHGGDMWVESEPGRGATFAFRLPLAPAPATLPAAS